MISVQNLTVRIKHKYSLFKGVSFNLADTKKLILTGRNGSGKSSLLKAISGLLPEDVYSVEGKIFYNNIEIPGIKDKDLSLLRGTSFSYTFQDAKTSYDPTKKLKYYIKYANQKKILFYLDKLNAPDLSVYNNKYIYELSGGEAQKFALALALSREYRVLLLDEPTSALDNYSTNLLCEILNNSEEYFIITTQDKSLIEKLNCTQFCLDDFTNDNR